MTEQELRFMVAVREAQSAAEQETDLEARLRAAMRVTLHHWLMTDEDGRLKAAVGAVMVISDEETKSRLETEVRGLQTLSAMMSGVPVDLAVATTELEASNPVGLIRLWNEVKEEDVGR